MKERRFGAHRGPISPACSEDLFITACKWEQYSTARQLHLLPFTLYLSLTLSHSAALSPPETQQRATPTSHSAPLHACEVEIGCSTLSKVSKLSPLPGMFSLSLYVSSVMFWKKKKKINQTSWFLIPPPPPFFRLRQFQLGTGKESATGTKAELQLTFEEC